MTNGKHLCDMTQKLVFHGSFNTKSDRANVLLLLPKTKGPFGTKKFKDFFKDNFNLLEYDDVSTEKLGAFNAPGVTSLEHKSSVVNIALERWKGIEFHIICHSTGCGLGTFLAKKNKETCKSLILISPWNKADEEFTSIQKKRMENAKNLETIIFLQSEYNLLYSNEYIHKYDAQFNKHILNQKDKTIDFVQVEKRLQSILDCDIGKELSKLMLPKLLINSLDDKLMKVHHAQELKKLSTNSNLISLDKGGHMLTETRADDLNEYIKSFIDSVG